MSEIKHVLIRTVHKDGTTREYRADKNPAGMTLKFLEDGGVEAQSVPENPVLVTVTEFPAR
jgi:hypothetical protein